jgi:hypothetical protein
VLAVERGPGVCRHLDRPHRLAAGGIERIDPVARRKPDMAAVEGQSVHVIDARERAVLVDDLGGRLSHVSLLAFGDNSIRRSIIARQRRRE